MESSKENLSLNYATKATPYSSLKLLPHKFHQSVQVEFDQRLTFFPCFSLKFNKILLNEGKKSLIIKNQFNFSRNKLLSFKKDKLLKIKKFELNNCLQKGNSPHNNSNENLYLFKNKNFINENSKNKKRKIIPLKYFSFEVEKMENNNFKFNKRNILMSHRHSDFHLKNNEGDFGNSRSFRKLYSSASAQAINYKYHKGKEKVKSIPGLKRGSQGIIRTSTTIRPNCKEYLLGNHLLVKKMLGINTFNYTRKS